MNNTITTNLNTFSSGYSQVNSIKMYYEIHGQGKPLVLIHGGGTTIETSFGKIIPMLALHRQVIAMEPARARSIAEGDLAWKESFSLRLSLTLRKIIFNLALWAVDIIYVASRSLILLPAL